MNTVPTLQDQFDRMAVHLLTQLNKSENDVGCAYRGECGLMCAVGPLIKEDAYSEEMEGEGVSNPIVAEGLKKSGEFDDTDMDSIVGFTDETLRLKLFRAMQHLHDNSNPHSWSDDLIALATKHGLSTAAIDNFNPN